jgi:hypothetical protein
VAQATCFALIPVYASDISWIATHPDLRPLACLVPLSQYSSSGIWSWSSPSITSKPFQITLPGASRCRCRRTRLEAELLGGVWSLKLTERQRDLVGRSVHESADLAHFFPGARYGKDIAQHSYGHALVAQTKRDPRLIIDFFTVFLVRENADHHICAASIPRLHPPISVRLLPLLVHPQPPLSSSSSARPLSNAVVAKPLLKSPDLTVIT